MKKFSAFLAAVLATVLAAHAVPARPGFRTITQPDGTEITAELVGDEYVHFYRTPSGAVMTMDEDGYLRFAKAGAAGELIQGERLTPATSTRIMARSELDRTYDAISRRARAARQEYSYSGIGLTGSYPRTGDVHCLVFIVEYTDVKFKVDDPHSFFTDMLNKPGFNQYNGTGSVRDYFLDQSNGEFRPTYDVFGPVQLANKQSYYGANDFYGNDMAPEEMVLEAVEAYKDEIDFSEYDYDNDGRVDNIYVIYAGEGEASYGGRNTVWPHSYFIYGGPTYNGKTVYSYTCSNEWESTKPDGIGTFCHEFSHTMGLPDLYTTDYNTSATTLTPGDWSVLDNGPYNNDGRTPPNYSAFERNAMGWLNGIEVTAATSIELKAIHESNEAVVIGTDKANEFFLFENRQREGWDKYLPGHGMLVWHIDYNETRWKNNTVNNTTHQYVDIVEANNKANNESTITMSGYAFPGTARNTEFTYQSTPQFTSWSGADLGLPITNIQEIGGIISFDVDGGAREVDVPTDVQAQANDHGEINVTWSMVNGANDYRLNVYTRDDSNEPVYFADYHDKSVGRTSSHTVSGLEGNTTYFVTLCAANPLFTSAYTDEIAVEVPEISFRYSTPVATEPVDVTSDAFTATWEQLPGAVRYYLTVETTATVGEHPDQDLDFGKGTSMVLPDGWSWSGAKTALYYSSSFGYFGKSAPSLKFSADGRTLESPVFESPVDDLSYWLRGASASDDTYLTLEGRSRENAQWTDFTPAPLSDYNSAGSTVELNLAGSNIRQIRFILNVGTKGQAALDDVHITFAKENFLPVDGFDRSDCGAATEADVTGIPSDANLIRYYVEAENDEGIVSNKSNIVQVTLAESGLRQTIAGDAALTVSGHTVAYRGNSGDAITVADIAGRIVATATAGSDGIAATSLPAGFYIIATPAGASRVIIR